MNFKKTILVKLAGITVLLLFVLIKTPVVSAAEITIDGSVNASNESQKGRNLVWTTPTIGYFFYVDVTTNDLVYVKTTNGGRTWGSIVNVNTGAITKVSVWYDKWTTGDTGTKIHIAYLETTTASANTANYRDLDTSSDTFGADTTVNTFGAGAASWLYSESEVSITKARGGNLYIAAAVAAGTHDFYRCTGTCNTGGNWTSRAALFESSVTDGVILMPGGESDNQDILALYWDYSADEISLKTYDDSGNTIGETSISTSMVESTTYGVQWSAVQRQSDNHVILAAWNALDSATADLKSWDITNSSTITAKTDIITDQAETAMVSLMINQSDDTIYAAYMQGDTFTSLVDAVYKLSVSGGATWSAQAQFSVTEDDLRWIDAGCSMSNESGRFQPVWQNDDLNDMITSYAYIWDGGGGDNNWNTASNWLTDTAPSVASDWLVFSSVSSKSATLNTSPSVGGIHILPWYSGTITQSSTNTVTLDVIGYSQNSGVFSGGSGTIDINSGGDFSLSGGIFNSTSGTFTFYSEFTRTGGTFTHNSGTVYAFGIDYSNGYEPDLEGYITFNNLYFYNDACCNGGGSSVTSGIATVSGTLTFEGEAGDSRKQVFGPGQIHAQGDIQVLQLGLRGDVNIVINGAGDQDLIGIASPTSEQGRLPSVTINKSSGTLTITDSIRIAESWTYQQGTLVTTGSTVIFHIGPDANPNTDVTVSGTHTLNNVTIEFVNCCNGRNFIIDSGTLTVAGTTLITEDGGSNNKYMYGPGVLSPQGAFTIGSTVNLSGGDLGITFSGSNNQTLTVNGDDTMPSGTFTVNKSAGTVTLAADLTINDTGQDLIISSGTLDIAGFSLTVNDQFSLGATGTLKLQGGETTVSTIDTITDGSTVEYTGSGTYSSLKAGSTYSNLTISGSGSFTPASNVTLSGNFTQSAGTFSVAPSGMTVSRNFARSGGTFVPGSSTVTFDNAGYTSSVSGTTTFYNLTSIIPSKTLRFASNSTTTVSNALTLRGSSEGLLTLESTDAGYPWNLSVNGTATLSKLDVTDSSACGGSTKPLTTTGSIDGGNNYCWNISGSYTDWYNTSWTKRRSITINKDKVSGSHTDFPVLVKLASDANLASLAQDDGDDILLTSDDGVTKLSHEIEKFDGSTGEIVLWVKVPSLTSDSNTTLYMYYGNGSATNQEDVINVWNSNYALVHHMDETSGTNTEDSTTNNNDGTKTSSTEPNPTTSGIIGTSQDFAGDNDRNRVTDHNTLDITSAGTVSTWINFDAISSWRSLFYKGNTNNNNGNYFCEFSTTNYLYCGVGNGSSGQSYSTDSTIADTTNNYYVTFTWNGSNLITYINGVQAGTATQTITPVANALPLDIGNFGGDVDYMNGLMDEFRVSNTNRSADWILTEYNNQSSPSTFFTISAESNVPSSNVRGGVRILPGTRIIAN